MTEVEGGLDEPDELEPEQGDAGLAVAEDRLDTRRLGEGRRRGAAQVPPARARTTPTRDVWDEADPARRSTASGSRPLGTAALLDDLVTRGRPTRAGAWDVRHPRSATQRQAALADLERRRHLACGCGPRSAPTSPTPARRASCSTSLRSSSTRRPLEPRRVPRRTPTAASSRPGTNLGVEPGRRRPASPSPRSRARPACSASSSTRPPCTTGAPPTCQELGYALAVGARALRALTDAGIPLDEAAGLIEFRLRRDRRAVPHDRQAPRGPPALGAGRSSSATRRVARAAPARGDQPADDEQPTTPG